MNIVCTTNTVYLESLKVLLYSLFLSQENEIVFYLISYSLKDDEILEIKSLCTALDIEFVDVRVPENLYTKIYNIAKVPLASRGVISIETLFKLFIPFLLPSTVHRVLYLDTDILVKDNLSLLYNFNLEKNILFAIKDPIMYIEDLSPLKNIYMKAHNLSDSFSYINAGVLLLNLDSWRSLPDFTEEKIFEYLSTDLCSEDLDQGIFNTKFRDYTVISDNIEYNSNPRYSYLEDSIIVHFMQSKPWFNILSDIDALPAVLSWRKIKKQMKIVDKLLKERV